jgi:uncharacterized membrane protein YgcG
MNRSRALSAVVLSVVLLAAAAPSLEARPLAKPQVSVSAFGGEWLSAAWSWLAQALRIEPATPAARQEKLQSSGSGGTTTQSGGGLGGAHPMNGSCIDPNGCTFGGGGT